MAVTPMAVVVVGNLLLLGFLGLLSTLFDHLDVIVENSSNDRDHISLDNPRPYILGTANSYVNDALEGQVPLPHVHHVLAPALLQNADQSLYSAIDG
jgi:hypothetical protein